MNSITFECVPIRSHDQEGRVVSAGAAWREGTQSKRGKMYIGVVVSGAALIVLWIGLAAGVMELTGIALVGFAFTGIMFAWPSPERELVFDVHGKVRTAQGTAYDPYAILWDIRSADVVSVEVMKHQDRTEQFRHDVALLTDDGDTFRIAGDLHVEHATKVARQLTKALAEVRAAEGADLYHRVG